MNYTLINSNGEVLEISKKPIVTMNDNFRVVRINEFEDGDEINYYIVVLDTNDDGIVTAYSAVKQTPFISTILQENAMLKNSLADLWEIVLLGGDTI
ncbi:hypothetical protein [Lysinibacillus sp. FSL W8-0953]|uniref:hypothetical protein n=1 Tax=Lysinibacillus sp. FSL W8-0953 TaxID=2954640 RepID=UPI0030F8887C